MTFDNAAYAIDGATLTSAIARRAEFAATSGAQGIVQKADLKVKQLAVPGVGFLIDAGVGLVRNDYQDFPSESYVVSNPSTHTFPSGSMPASNPAAKSYLVAVVIGDPDFSQTGHPWMGASDPPLGQEQSFQYVRVTLIEVAAGVTTLDVAYPALILARIDIPANTTTITNSHITDLRKLARPQQSQEIFVSPGGTWTSGAPRRISASASTFSDWGPQEYLPQVKVPTWATRAILVVTLNGVRLDDTTASVAGRIRAQMGAVTGPQTFFDYSTGGGAIRDNLQAAGQYDVTSIAGTTVALRVEGYESAPGSPTNSQKLTLQQGSQMVFDVRFFEE
jgi:hypothetical protein